MEWRKRIESAFFLSIGAFIVLTSAACGKFESNEALRGLSRDPSSLGVAWGKVEPAAQSLLKRRCAYCHNSQLALGGISEISNFDYLRGKRLIVPGNAQASPLYQSLASKRMPASGDFLNEIELRVIADWINGANTIMGDETKQCSTLAAQLEKPTEARIWTISGLQYANIIGDVFGVTGSFWDGFPAPSQDRGFRYNVQSVNLDDFMLFQFDSTAETLSARIANDDEVMKRVWPCAAYSPDTSTPECVSAFVSSVGSRLFRRPLEDGERSKLLSLYSPYQGEAQPNRNGARRVLQALLFSPSFIYRKEFGSTDSPGMRSLTSYQIAESLSFMILESVPDAELWAAAKADLLTKPETRSQQILRLLDSPRGEKFFAKYIGDMVEVETVSGLNLPVENSDQLKADMLEEFNLFIANVVASNDSFSKLFNSRRTFVNQNLATSVYGYSGFGEPFQPLDLDPAQRSGFLTLPAVLTASSGLAGGVAALKRGKMVRERFFCLPLGDPPPDAVSEPPSGQLPPNFDQLSRREQFEAKHLHKTSCTSCHSVIDPVGFGMDHFTKIGAFNPRDPATNAVLDVRGEVKFTSSSDFKFSGAAQLAEGLGRSLEVKECFAQETYRYVIGRQKATRDACGIERAAKTFVSGSGNIKQLVVDILNDEIQSKRWSE